MKLTPLAIPEVSNLHSYTDGRDGVWIRENGYVDISLPVGAKTITIQGLVGAALERESRGKIGLNVRYDVHRVRQYPLAEGPFSIEVPVSFSESRISLCITLLGARRSNALAYLGRRLNQRQILPRSLREWFGRFRAQRLNQRLALHSILVDGVPCIDWKTDPANAFSPPAPFPTSAVGVNLIGWFDAQFGIGESARLAAKAFTSSNLRHVCLPLRVRCSAARDAQFDAFPLRESPQYRINIFHVNPPECGEIDRCHGTELRSGRYNIGYWAWELPAFPDEWIKHFKSFDEIWTPSRFAADSIALKSPIPVVVMPHCVDFVLPEGDFRALLGLPIESFIFTSIYDLSSHQERKNPQATIEAFRRAFAGSPSADRVALVIKVQSAAEHPRAYASLKESLASVPNAHLISQTLDRRSVYGLISASDVYVSLHRAEGFGLTVAEGMFLGKPVISTDWSATREFLDASNGCPVRCQLKQIERTTGPYTKGQYWAEPDIEHAAEYMRHLEKNRDQAEAIGRRAQLAIRARFGPESSARRIERRIRAIVTR